MNDRPVAANDEPAAGADHLDLADWRRRVADLYAAVRSESEHDPEAAWRRWCEIREELFRSHPQSPVPVADRATFRARHWPYDPRLRLEATLAPAAADHELETAPVADLDVGGLGSFGGLGGLVEPLVRGYTLALPVSTGGEQAFTRIGFLDIPFASGSRRLGLYWMAGYAGGLFLPFRDGTSGRETYGAGRYLLDAAKSADLGSGATPGSLLLDFNFSFQPSCAFDPRWSCPLAPAENRLDSRIEAGERLA